MMRRWTLGSFFARFVPAAACLFWGAAGCGPSKDQLRLNRAMNAVRYELHPDYRDALDILEKSRQADRNKNEFVLLGMCEVTVGMLGGNCDAAEQAAKHTHLAVKKYQDTESEKRAAMGNEAAKFFKGEPHERAFLAFYAGALCYLKEEYNDARIFFMQSLLESATRDEDMTEFREDFPIGHYWLGRAYLKLGQEDNARIAFQKAAAQMFYKNEEKELKKTRSARTKAYKDEMKGEAQCFKNGSKGKAAIAGIVDLSKPTARSEMPQTLPNAAEPPPVVRTADSLQSFLAPDFQKAANLFVIVEMGPGPLKYLEGRQGTYDEYRRLPRKEDGVDLYVDGHRSGSAFVVVDMYHQAVTRGVKTRRGRQTSKAVTKEILTHLPYIGDVAKYWDVQGDARHWSMLPGAVAVIAAQVKPGSHTIALKFFDADDKYLPRFDLTRHYIPVPEEGERVLILSSLENQDNAYLLSQAAKP